MEDAERHSGLTPENKCTIFLKQSTFFVFQALKLQKEKCRK